MVDFHLFADDTNFFFPHKKLQIMESIINHELCNIIHGYVQISYC